MINSYELAPRTELRNSSATNRKWNDFRKKFKHEPYENIDQVSILTDHLKDGSITLVYDAKDQEYIEALFLKNYLAGKYKKEISIELEIV